MAWSQKLRLTLVIQPPTLLWNVLFCLILLTSVVQNVCVCTMDSVSAGKNTLLLYVTACEKVVPRLNKHDDVIEWNENCPPPERKSWLRPCPLVMHLSTHQGISLVQKIVGLHVYHLEKRLMKQKSRSPSFNQVSVSVVTVSTTSLLFTSMLSVKVVSISRLSFTPSHFHKSYPALLQEI